MIELESLVTNEDLGKNKVKLDILKGYEFPPDDNPLVGRMQFQFIDKDFNSKLRLDALTTDSRSITDSQIREIVESNIDGIIHDMANTEEYRKVFLDRRVVAHMTNVLQARESIELDSYCDLNRLLFSVLSWVPDMTRADYVALGMALNKVAISNILKLNQRGYRVQTPISKEMALYITISRFSTNDHLDVTPMSRVVHLISSTPGTSAMFNNRSLADLYNMLFSNIEGIVIGGLLRLVDPTYFTQEAVFMDLLQGDAVLDLLETQTMDTIIRVLHGYGQYIEYRMVEPERVKYSLSNINTERYPMIWQAVNILASYGEIL